MFFLDTFALDFNVFSILSAFFVACFLMPVVLSAYETDVIEHSWSGKEMIRGEERISRCSAARPLSSISLHKNRAPLFFPAHTGGPAISHNACVLRAHLICGNGGSSDEGCDGGLCDHAVGGDAVRRGVEPGERKFVKFQQCGISQ